MEFLLELILQILVEVVLPALLELGVRSIFETIRTRPNPWLAAIGYLLIGALIGAITVHFLPRHLWHAHAAQSLNLIMMPLLVGVIVAFVGRVSDDRGPMNERDVRLWRFADGYLFAFGIALVRLLAAR